MRSADIVPTVKNGWEREIIKEVIMNNCTFCGSKDILLETPYTKLSKGGKHAPETRFCCKAQARNAQHREKKYVFGQAPSMEKIGKL